MKKFYFLLALVSFSCIAAPVFALGVGVKPKEINLDVAPGKKIETEILVMNVATEPAIYQVYPDALDDEIKISPNDFRLNPNESQIVKVKVEMKNTGKFATDISIVAHPVAAGGLSTGTGVKVPIMISVSGLAVWQLILGLVAGACLLVVFIVKFRERFLKKKL